MCFAPQRRALFRRFFPHRNLQKWSENVSFLRFWLGNVLRATTACAFSPSQLPKVERHWGCFLHFHFEMCFAPQRRALFWHLNFQKWSEPLRCFVTFWLGNVLRATTAYTFSTCQLPKVVRTMVCFCTFWLGNVLRATTACNFSSLIWPASSAPAALASLLFDSPEPQIIGKTQWIATFLPFRASVSSVLLLFLFYSSLF